MEINMNISKIIVSLVASAFITSAFAAMGQGMAGPAQDRNVAKKVVKVNALQKTQPNRQARKDKREERRATIKEKISAKSQSETSSDSE